MVGIGRCSLEGVLTLRHFAHTGIIYYHVLYLGETIESCVYHLLLRTWVGI